MLSRDKRRQLRSEQADAQAARILLGALERVKQATGLQAVFVAIHDMVGAGIEPDEASRAIIKQKMTELVEMALEEGAFEDLEAQNTSVIENANQDQARYIRGELENYRDQPFYAANYALSRAKLKRAREIYISLMNQVLASTIYDSSD